MTRPLRIKERPDFVQAYLRRFQEEHIKPARDRVHADPNCLNKEARKLFDAAKSYFRSTSGGLPGNKEALYLFAVEHLEGQGETIERILVGNWRDRGTQVRLAELTLRPPRQQATYSASSAAEDREDGFDPGFVYFAGPGGESSTYRDSQPPPPPPPRDPVELDLEAKVRSAEEVLEKVSAELRSYREAKAKAEQQAREREARARAERERMQRGQASQHAEGRPRWAIILDLTPPFTEDRIKAAYRTKAKLTHPDRGGTSKAFVEVNSAYDVAMASCRSRLAPAM